MTREELTAEHQRLAAEAETFGERWLDAFVRGHDTDTIHAALDENNQARKRVERKLHALAKREAKAAA